MLAASLALVVGFVWVMRAGALPLMPPPGTLSRLDGWLVLGFVLAMLTSMLLKYARYHFLIAPIARLSLRRVMVISSIGMGLVTLLPFRLGEFARPAMLREKGKVSGWAVTGTVGVERIVDGVAFGLTLLLGLTLAPPRTPLPDHIGNLPVPAALIPRAAVAATIGFALALVVMATFYWSRSFARRLTERVLGVVSQKLATRVADIVTNMSQGFGFLPKLRFTVPYLLTTALLIVAHVWAIQLLARAVGLPDISFARSAVIVGVLALGFALPNAPGFFGAVQLALYAALVLYVDTGAIATAGAALVLVFYVTYLGIVLGLAVIALLLEYLSPMPVSEA